MTISGMYVKAIENMLWLSSRIICNYTKKITHIQHYTGIGNVFLPWNRYNKYYSRWIAHPCPQRLGSLEIEILGWTR